MEDVLGLHVVQGQQQLRQPAPQLHLVQELALGDGRKSNSRLKKKARNNYLCQSDCRS